MAELSKREKRLDWACRILMTFDLLVILAGYLSYFQAERQLVSPLIPKDMAIKIFSDSGDVIMKACIAAGIIFLSGLWLYTFKKKTLALILLICAPVCFKLLIL